MKKIILSTLAVVTIVSTQAQKKRFPEQGQHFRYDHMMAEKLKLSEEQKQKAKTLNEEFRKNLTDLRKKDDITVKDWRNRMEMLQKKHREDMQNLLNKEQKDKIEKFRLEKRKMADIDANARLEKMKLRLDLDNAQVEKLKMQRSEMMEKMKAIHENKSMDIMQKREEMKLLMEKRKAMMKSILTEDQMKKFRDMKRGGPPKKRRLSRK